MQTIHRDEIQILEREMLPAEFAQMKAGFDAYALEHGNPSEIAERFGFVVMVDNVFAGVVSGLAQRVNDAYAPWFYMSDLFIEKAYRGQGLGYALLSKMETKVKALGLHHIWLWTAGYEAPEFYKRQGYTVFCEMEQWYASGHSRFGLRKKLLP